MTIYSGGHGRTGDSILRQAAVANLVKAPQSLDHMEGVLDTRASSGAATVDKSLILAQRSTPGGTPLPPVVQCDLHGASRGNRLS